MKITDVVIGKRFRKNLGKLDGLIKSIQEEGLLHPIVVNERNELVAGFRRIKAFEELGLADIPATQIKIENKVKGEYAENAHRLNFTPSEAVAIYEAIENRQGLRPNLGRSEDPRKIEKAAKAAGMSTGSLSKAKAVIEHGDRKLIEQMDKTGKVNDAYKKVKREQRIETQAEKGKTIKEIPAQLHNMDFNKVILPENSVDLILTDPPYPVEFIDCWKQLAEYADKVLKPSGFLVAYSGQLHLEKVMQALSSRLEYYWTFCLYHTGQTKVLVARNIQNRWKPILVYQKKPFKKHRVIDDYIISEQPEKEGHDWQQSESGAVKLIEQFTEIGAVVLDPMMGAGTFPYVAHKLKRKAIGIEQDVKFYNVSRGRYADKI